MPKSNKKKEVVYQTFDQKIDEVVDQLLEAEKQVYTNKLQSWEIYCQKKRVFMHESMQQFRKSLLNGYQALIREIKNGPKE